MSDGNDVLVVTTPMVASMTVLRTLGSVFGVVVRSRGLGGNVVAGLRSLAGGEIKEYTDMLEPAREHALSRMKTKAAELGANGVVAMRFDSSELGKP
ncbi:heavy metal-binding domain-containing protein [Sulfobacillus harzensis]|uniref:heavy metal-binding domain-containing protein n=1 Tax=Sulfobacillus harzensis TaxID=2729629 RepID=UPI003B83160F